MYSNNVQKWNTSYAKNRRDEIVITRLRIGHTRISDVFLMSTEFPQYAESGVNLTVKHILTECLAYNEETDDCQLSNEEAVILSDHTQNYSIS